MNQSSFTPYLTAGERVLWWGRPKRGFLFTRSDAATIPFSLVWFGFSVFWTVSATKAAGLGPFTLFGLAFMGFGVFILIGRFFYDAMLRRRTLYALTNRRVLILREGSAPRLTALGLDQIPDIQLEGHAKGRGTIRFAPSRAAHEPRNAVPSMDRIPQFLAIENAKMVFGQIQQQIQREKTASAALPNAV